MVDRAKKVTELGSVTQISNNDLLIVVANTSGAAVTKNITARNLLASIADTNFARISRFSTQFGNVAISNTSAVVNIIGGNSISTSASGNTISISFVGTVPTPNTYSAANITGLSVVAITGNYYDLANRPHNILRIDGDVGFANVEDHDTQLQIRGGNSISTRVTGDIVSIDYTGVPVLPVDSVSNTSITIPAAANSVKRAYETAIQVGSSAYLNAISYGVNYADMRANTAYINAVSHSDTKSDAAYSNAIVYAATIADSHAAVAYANAIIQINTRANIAYSNAIIFSAADAQNKATTAYANAVITAAADASLKADDAYSNAIIQAASIAALQANTAYANAVAYTIARAATNNYVNALVSTKADINSPTFVGTVTLPAIAANGSIGIAGQVLVSNGYGTYWATIDTGSGDADVAYANAVAYANIAAHQAYANAITYSGNAAQAYANAVAYAASNTYVNAELALKANINNPTFTGNVYANNILASGDVTIDGSLYVTGNTVTVSTVNLEVEDNMIYLNKGPESTPNTFQTGAHPNPDIGLAGNYNDGTYRHTGFFRDASDGVWKIFDRYTPEPDASIYIDTAHPTFRIADFQANTLFVHNVDVTGLVNGTSTFANNAFNLDGLPGSYYANLATSAYSNSIAFATAAANQAYTNAVAFATAAANQAYANAVALAAQDAASKASIAYSNAVLYAASNTYVNNTFAPKASPTFTGTVTISAINANGSLGTDGQVLTTNGTAVYWESVLATGNGSIGSLDQVLAVGNTTSKSLTTGTLTVNGYVYIANNRHIDTPRIALNGSLGVAGYVLASNGAGPAYWKDIDASVQDAYSNAIAYTQTYTYSRATIDGKAPIANPVFTGSVTLPRISANNSYGVAGQVLTSNGAGVYWSTPTVSSNGSSNNVVSITQYVAVDKLFGDGTTTQFSLSTSGSYASVQVYVDGLLYVPDVDYTVTNTTLAFAVAPLIDQSIVVYHSGASSNVATQADVDQAYANAVAYAASNTYVNTELALKANTTNPILLGTVVLSSLSANGSTGTSGQVLTTDGTVAYWSTPSAANGSVGTLDQVLATGNTTTKQMTTGTILPSSTQTYNLGNSSRRWGNFYTLNADISYATLGQIQANGSLGTAGQVLTTNGSEVYWSTVSGGTGGFTNGQSISVNNFAVSGSFTANNSTGSAGQILYSTGTTVYWGAPPVANGSVGTLDQVLAAGNTTTKALTVGPLTVNGSFTANSSNGTTGQVLTSSGNGIYWSTPQTSAQYTAIDQFNGDGVTSVFSMSVEGTNSTIQVYVNGLLYTPDIDYTVSTLSLIFTVPPSVNHKVVVYHLAGGGLSGGAISGGSAKIFPINPHTVNDFGNLSTSAVDAFGVSSMYSYDCASPGFMQTVDLSRTVAYTQGL